MTAAVYILGVPVAQANHLVAKVGLLHPTEKGQYKMTEKMKEVVKEVRVYFYHKLITPVIY